MEKLKAGIEFIFSSYKRTAAVLFIAALTLAIPITVSLIGQQQDIRQRAEGLLPKISGYPLPSGIMPSRTLSGYPQLTPKPTGDIQPSGYPLPSGIRISGYPLPSGIYPSTTISKYPSGIPSIFPSPASTKIPTATPTVPPGQTQIALSLLVTGIGADVSKGQNANPKNAQRAADVKVFNSQNQEIASIKGSVVYSRESGNYEGRISLGGNVASGSYTVKVKLDNTLWKTIPGIQVLTTGAVTQTSTTALVSGDINQDNEINLLDYTMMISCLADAQCRNAPQARIDVTDFLLAIRSNLLGNE